MDIRTQFLLCPTAQSPTVAETLHPAFSGVQQYTGRGSPALTCGRQSWSRHPARGPCPSLRLSTPPWGPLRIGHSPLSLVLSLSQGLTTFPKPGLHLTVLWI